MTSRIQESALSTRMNRLWVARIPLHVWTEESQLIPILILQRSTRQLQLCLIQTISTATVADEFGRPLINSVGGIAAQIGYDSNGRASCQTNPSTSGPPYSTPPSVCVTSYDGLDRPLVKTNTDSSTITSIYSANAVLSNDETHASTWVRTSNAFGQLISVVEPSPGGAALTSYQYDGLGNIHTITQNGSTGDTPRIRTFTYDSLSRLVCSSQPESSQPSAGQPSCPASATGAIPSGAMQYSYYQGGQIQTKTDANGVTSTYTYDSLNRLHYKSYSDGTQLVGYGYDGYSETGLVLSQPHENTLGRLSIISNTVNVATTFSYDSIGRLLHQENCVPSTCDYHIKTTASYDQAGHLIDLWYPDLRHVSQRWDSRAHDGFLWNPSNASQPTALGNYIKSVTYFPSGSPNTVQLGDNGLQVAYGLDDKRLQMVSEIVSSTAAAFNGQGVPIPFLLLRELHERRRSEYGKDLANGGYLEFLAKTQDYTYDSLSRLTGNLLGGVSAGNYQLDAFGNSSPTTFGTPVNTFSSSTNAISNLSCVGQNGQQYDAAGRQLCEGSNGLGNLHQYSYDAEGRMGWVSNGTTILQSYYYGADDNRAEKSNSNHGSYTDYVYFGGQLLAQIDQTGTWTDYIYGEGNQKIARAVSQVPMVHLYGSNPVSGVECAATLAGGINYSVQTSDKLSWLEYKNNAVGGMMQFFDNNTIGDQWHSVDTSGHGVNQDTRENQWVARTFDMSEYAGHTLSSLGLTKDVDTPAAAWDIWYSDIAIISANGTVTPIMGSSGQASVSGAECQGQMDYVGVEIQTNASAPGIVGSGADTHFYVGDHLGTAQMEFSSGGWPVWQGQFGPYGQELDNQYTANNYKFAGLERDSESSLDHATYRQLSFSQGRWMSPDPYDGSIDINNPQSFNRYGYAFDSPLNFIDPSGLQGVDPCHGDPTGCGGGGGCGWICGVSTIGIGAAASAIASWFDHPSFHGSLHARPGNLNGKYSSDSYFYSADGTFTTHSALAVPSYDSFAASDKALTLSFLLPVYGAVAVGPQFTYILGHDDIHDELCGGAQVGVAAGREVAVGALFAPAGTMKSSITGAGFSFGGTGGLYGLQAALPLSEMSSSSPAIPAGLLFGTPGVGGTFSYTLHHCKAVNRQSYLTQFSLLHSLPRG